MVQENNSEIMENFRFFIHQQLQKIILKAVLGNKNPLAELKFSHNLLKINQTWELCGSILLWQAQNRLWASYVYWLNKTAWVISDESIYKLAAETQKTWTSCYRYEHQLFFNSENLHLKFKCYIKLTDNCKICEVFESSTVAWKFTKIFFFAKRFAALRAYRLRKHACKIRRKAVNNYVVKTQFFKFQRKYDMT